MYFFSLVRKGKTEGIGIPTQLVSLDPAKKTLYMSVFNLNPNDNHTLASFS